jgi:hypothetical protein
MGSKLVGGIVVLLVLVGGWWAAMNVISTDDSYLIYVAFGVPYNDAIEMNTLISPNLPRIEPPRVNPRTRKVEWQMWADNHFDLREASGAKVKVVFRENMERSFIPSGKIIGAPDGYLHAVLTQGIDYTFDYIPIVSEKTSFRHSFTSPTDVKSVAPVAFRQQQ